jgi:predicted DCC family thiol-disulfide oxidoreductase YuxK
MLRTRAMTVPCCDDMKSAAWRCGCQAGECAHVDAMPLVTVWFDGSCPLCSREIVAMRRLDRREAIAFVDVGQAGAVCPIDRDVLLTRFHARETGGPLLSGASAFAAMWRAIPLLRPLGLLARNALVLWMLERLYRGFLRIRPVLTGRATGA